MSVKLSSCFVLAVSKAYIPSAGVNLNTNLNIGPTTRPPCLLAYPVSLYHQTTEGTVTDHILSELGLLIYQQIAANPFYNG